MAKGIPTRLSPAEGRKFGFTLAMAFALLGALMWWRDVGVLWRVLLAIALAFGAGGLVAPGRMGPVHDAWMGLAHAISRVTTPVFMGIVYFLVITPIAMLMRAMGHNPLGARVPPPSLWRDRDVNHHRSNLERQF